MIYLIASQVYLRNLQWSNYFALNLSSFFPNSFIYLVTKLIENRVVQRAQGTDF